MCLVVCECFYSDVLCHSGLFCLFMCSLEITFLENLVMVPHPQIITHTYRQQDHFWILLSCQFFFFYFFFYLFMLQGAFYILAQSSKCALQFLSIRWMWSCSNHHLPLPPGSTGLSIFLTVFLFEMLYNLLGWGTIPEKKHIQRTAIRYCTICFQVGCFQATLKETALS